MQKKKCGMVTLYDDNFGTCLQAFALFKSIESLGYDPSIIKYVRGEKTGGQTSKWDKLKGMSVSSLFKYVRSYGFIKDRKEGFQRFRMNYFRFHDGVNYRNAVQPDLPEKYDAFVCGSDMIWSEEFIADWNWFFLQFVPYEKRISYAPSFGKNEIAPENQSLCKKNIEGIRFRSCREWGGVQLIDNLFGLQTELLVDPTMLMDGEQWRKIISNRSRMVKDDYYITYVFGGTDGVRKGIFSELDKKQGIGKRKVIPMNQKQNGKYAVKGSLGPIEFLTLYRDSKFIVTDTFHGLLFALIFEKPFVVLEREDKGHWAKYSDRMTSTLEMLGLESRYINSMSEIKDEFLTLDYSKINAVLLKKRIDSLFFLENSLREVSK